MGRQNAAWTVPGGHEVVGVTYVQRRKGRQLQTVEAFEAKRHAVAALPAYRAADADATYYISNRPCRDWRAKGN